MTELPDLNPESIVTDPAPQTARDIVREVDAGKQLCGGRVEFVWAKGRNRGLPFTAYCAEPLCLDDGECHGPMFVPHVQQFTTLDPENPTRKERKPSQRELIEGTEKAIQIAGTRGANTGIGYEMFGDGDELVAQRNRYPIRRDDMAKYIGMVWRKTIRAMRGEQGWRKL